MSENSLVHTFDLHPSFEIAYVGPNFSSGPLPALFYFSLSAEDSLGLDPFNQPVSYLSSLPLRIFSITLPGHENKLPPKQAIAFWAKEIAQGHNVIAEFVEKIKIAVQLLSDRNILIPKAVGVSGLSRGAFIAAHAAAAIEDFRWILGFAPLTDLAFSKEFQDLKEDPIVNSLKLESIAPFLFDRSLRFYIGNHDTLVRTRRCFDFVEKLSQTAYDNQIRSSQIELIIGPSIGRDGHGTSKEVFHHGAQWIAEKLKVIDVL